MTPLVAFTGYARSGKDTAADALRREVPGAVVRAFADSLKVECAKAYGAPIEWFMIDEYKDTEFKHLALGNATDRRFRQFMAQCPVDMFSWRTPREIMQLYGTEYRRRLDGDDYWVERCVEVLDLYPDAPLHIITDCRFPNESAAVLNRRGQIWKIIRPGVERRSDHRSEAYIDLIAPTRFVHNDGTVRELSEKIRAYWLE